jgi:enoyl-CoA hydratase/carnithine racemase
MIESKDPHIKYSIDKQVFVIQIHRPEKKNALLASMYHALADGLKLADQTESVNVVLLKGVDDCFTSGNDVNSFVGNAAADEERPSTSFMHALFETRKPIVAAISGLAIGIGTTLLFHCDLIYASENCFLQLPFTRLGVCPEAGSSFLLPRQIGHQRAAELLLLGDRFSAEKARDYGIVNEVLPQDQYLEYALNRSHELASLPPLAVQKSKQLMKRGLESVLPDTIKLELEEFSSLLQTPAAQAIVQAFLERKKAS